MLVQRLLYYLRSIPTLLKGVSNWPKVVALFVGLPVRRPMEIVLRRTGLRFKVRSPMDVWIIKETCLDRDYERYGAELQEGWTVVDIGAGLGDFTLLASCAVGETGKVYAYEPFPESYALLLENIELNGDRNVVPYPYAVGAERGIVGVVEGAEAVQASTGAHPSSIQAEALTLADVLEPLAACDFLKVDVEGGEYGIFFSASDAVLAKTRLICLEYHDGVTPFSHGDLEQFLVDKGFQVVTQPSRVQPHLGFMTARQLIVP